MSVQVDLTAIDPGSLTKKQLRVYRALLKGKAPTTIAEEMKITPAGVYGHIRALNRLARAASSNGESTSNGDSGTVAEHETGSNGDSITATTGGYEVAVETIRQSLLAEQQVLAQSEQRVAEAAKLIEEAENAIKSENDEISRRATRIEALAAARDTLVTA